MNTKVPKKVKDITGQRFGRLTVLEFADYDQHDTAMWRVRCDCGTEFVTRGTHIRAGLTRSCGCLRNEIAASKIKKAWKSWAIPVVVTWRGEKVKCESIQEAAKMIGCAHSTVSVALRKGRPYREYSFEHINK